MFEPTAEKPQDSNITVRAQVFRTATIVEAPKIVVSGKRIAKVA